MARVYIGIPTWNRPDLAKNAIRSAVTQTFADIRIVVSDNDSPGSVAEEVEEFVRSLKDPRITFFKQPRNCGESGQSQYFLDKCNEDYIIFLHDDDRLEPNLVAAAVERLDHDPSVDFFSSNQYLFDEQGTVLEEETRSYNSSLLRDQLVDGPVDNILELVMERMTFALSGTVFRASTLRECGLEDDGGGYPFDLSVLLRQAENNKRVWWDSRKLLGYRWHANQGHRVNCWEFNERTVGGLMKLMEVRRFTGRPERLRRWKLAFAYRRYAYIKFVEGRTGDGYRYLAKAVCVDPLRYQLWGYVGIAFFLPFLIPRIWGGRVTLAEPDPESNA